MLRISALVILATIFHHSQIFGPAHGDAVQYFALMERHILKHPGDTGADVYDVCQGSFACLHNSIRRTKATFGTGVLFFKWALYGIEPTATV